MSIGAFITYLKVEKRSSKYTVKAYKTDLKQFETYIQNEFGCNPEDVSTNMIKSWIGRLKENNLDNQSINRKLSSLKAFYRFLQTNELITKNPISQIKTLKQKRRIAFFVPKSDMEKDFFLQTDGSYPSTRDLLIIEILYQTGIRVSELIGLKETDIDFLHLSLKVTGKGNKQRILPISLELSKQIQDYLSLKQKSFPGRNFLILSNTGKQAYGSMLYKIVREKLSEITTISKKSPHILRHTFATHMLNNGASLLSIRDFLGHESLAATQVYTHNSIEQLKSIHQQAHPKGGAK